MASHLLQRTAYCSRRTPSSADRSSSQPKSQQGKDDTGIGFLYCKIKPLHCFIILNNCLSKIFALYYYIIQTIPNLNCTSHFGIIWKLRLQIFHRQQQFSTTFLKGIEFFFCSLRNSRELIHRFILQITEHGALNRVQGCTK